MKKFIPLLILLLAIFISSSQTYNQQSIVPTLKEFLPNKPYESYVSKLQFHYYGMDISVSTRGYYYFLEFLVRKATHFFTFGAIGIAIYIALHRKKFRYLIAILMTFIIAATDEFHQSFTSGRTSSYQDVLLDTIGAIILVVVYKCIRSFLKGKSTE